MGKHRQTHPLRSTGVVGTARRQGCLLQRGRPGRLTGRAVQRRVRRRVGRASERLVVPWKPHNGGGGKGPHFWNAAEGATGSEIGVMPMHSEKIPLTSGGSCTGGRSGMGGAGMRGCVTRVGRAVNPVGEPDAGNLHVRFDERESETEP